MVCASNFAGAQDMRLESRNCTASSGDVYQFSEKKLISNEVIDLSQFRGKVCMLSPISVSALAKIYCV